MFTKVMVGNTTNPDSDDYTAHCVFRDGEWYHSDERDDVEFMQFTGLTDTNGVEIYEGDIVSDHNGIGVVKYSDKRAAYRVVYGDGTAKWLIDYNLRGERKSIKVIGNERQNPELLEQ